MIEIPKKFFIAILSVLILAVDFFNTAYAEMHEKPVVAVMDFGKHSDAANEIIIDNVGTMASDYIIEALVESKKFTVVAKDFMEETLAAEGLDTSGIIPPSRARKIGKILGVRYIIYGNVNDVNSDTLTVNVISNGADVHTVKALIIARMMDVETGDIVTAARGEGQSKSSKVQFGTSHAGYFTIGSKRVSQVSVHNAVKKAAYSMVELLVKRLED